jgi:exodeoxyribonuclease-3
MPRSKFKTLRLATYNINGIRSRLERLLEWLDREQPDVACLQELKAEDTAFPLAAIKKAGYGAVWHGERAWNGVAILARDAQPVELRRGLPGFASDTHSRYLEAAAHGLVVCCLYLPNGNPINGAKFAYKLDWFDRFIAHAETLYTSEHPVVLAGDFNVVPTDFDIYDPKSWRRDALLQPQTRARYAQLLAQGWADALRERHPGQRIYTFWDYFRNHWQRDAGLRIDHLLLNAALAPRLKAAGVDRWVRGQPGASDHAPTWIELGQSAPRAAALKRKVASTGRTSRRARSAAGAAPR